MNNIDNTSTGVNDQVAGKNDILDPGALDIGFITNTSPDSSLINLSENPEADSDYLNASEAVSTHQEIETYKPDARVEEPEIYHDNHSEINLDMPVDGNRSNRELMDSKFDNNINIVANEEPEKQGINEMNSVGIVQSVGHVLRNARLARKMSIEDVSRQLRLSVQQIEAIEKEDYEKLPGRTFLRGFVRNYANLVQLDPTPILQLLPGSAPTESTYERTPIKNRQISFSENREKSKNSQFIIIIILISLAAGAYFIYGNDLLLQQKPEDGSESVIPEIKKDKEKTTIELPLPLTSGIQSELKGSSTSTQIEAINAPKGETLKTAVSKTETSKTDALKTDTSKMTQVSDNSDDIGNLHFKFKAETWIKVSDNSGATLIEQVKSAGSEQVVTGRRPLSIVIGNTGGVSLAYNEKEVDIRSYTKKQDGTARFTLE